jgi:hypothetical protein
MACPDELTLDLWLAEALPSEEAATVAAHLATCATCLEARQLLEGWSTELHSALALDAEELTYLSGLGLASSWRASNATAVQSWGWIALTSVVAGFVAGLVAAPVFGSALAAAVQVGLGTVLVNAALTLAFGLGQALFELIQNPAFGLSQPLLALLALALLVWPRQLVPQRSTHA